MASDDDQVPDEIEEQCVELHHTVAAVDRVIKPLLATNRTALGETVSKPVSGCGHKWPAFFVRAQYIRGSPSINACNRLRPGSRF